MDTPEAAERAPEIRQENSTLCMINRFAWGVFMHEHIAREQAIVMYFEEKLRLKDINQRLLVPVQTIKSWIGMYKRKFCFYGRREFLKEIVEGKA
ncbi:MAG TPA: hypothetical protein PKJ47_04970 [Candidatus Limiplasma sp.]|nr:hypothetical protein [Candidatus Limiplasma sp.]